MISILEYPMNKGFNVCYRMKIVFNRNHRCPTSIRLEQPVNFTSSLGLNLVE